MRPSTTWLRCVVSIADYEQAIPKTTGGTETKDIRYERDFYYALLAVAMLIFTILIPVQLVYVYRPVNYAFQTDAIPVNASYEKINITSRLI